MPRKLKLTSADLKISDAARSMRIKEMRIKEIADGQQRRKKILDDVLELLREPACREFDEHGYSPLLKLACLLVFEHSEYLPVKTERVADTGEVKIGAIDAPSWVLQKSMEAQWRAKSKISGKGDSESSAVEVKNSIRTLLQYDFVQYLKSLNGGRLNVDQFLAELNPGITADGIKKRREKASKLQLGWMSEKFQFDGAAYFIFGIDTEQIERQFKQKLALQKVIK